MNFFKKNKEKMFLIFTTILILLLICRNTSPIINLIGADSGIFLLIGKLLSKGKTFYIDLFDHKGPILFFIEGIPQLFVKGSIGVWIVEAIFMIISVLIIYKISINLLKGKKSLFIPILYLLYMSLTFDSGNLSEEYSNLFNLVGLYIFCNFIENKYQYLKCKHCFILGICFAVIAFIRLNNAATLVAILLFMIISVAVEKKENLIKYILSGFLGVSLVAIPVCLYFISKNALYDMFYATYLYNFKYSDNTGIITKLLKVFITGKLGVVMIMLFALGTFSVIISIIKKDYKYAIFNILHIIITIVAIAMSGRPYMHYAMVGAPLFIFSIILILKNINKEQSKLLEKFYILVICLILILNSCIIAFSFRKVSISKNQKYYNDAITLSSKIPNEDKDEVFGYNVSAKWFYITDIIPCHKYFTLQDWWAINDKQITKDIINMFNNNPPKWVVLTDLKPVKSKEIQEIIRNKYNIIYKNDTEQLYKIKN